MGILKRTIKEQEFIKEYVKSDGNATKAYHQVFPHVKLESARRLASLLLTKLDIPMPELLDLIGVDDKALSEKLNQGLNATVTREVGVGKDKKKVTTPNYYVIARYLDMAYRLKAKYPIDETRLKLPGGDSATSVILRELIYTNKGKESKEDNKGKGKEEVNRIKTIIEDKAPF